MNNIIKVFIITLSIILFTSCYDRDIVDHKEFDHSLPKVENLKYTKSADVVKLTWQIPANISDDFKKPLEASIQVVENDIYKQKLIIGGGDTSADITIDTSKKYRFIVKLLGHLTDDAREDGITDRVYSEGQIIEIQ